MVRRISLFVGVAVFLGCCCFAWADQTSADDPEPAGSIYTKGRMSLQLVSGALFSLTGFPEGSPDLNYAQTNVRVGWMLATPGPGPSVLRGTWEGLVEVSNSIILNPRTSSFWRVTGNPAGVRRCSLTSSVFAA